MTCKPLVTIGVVAYNNPEGLTTTIENLLKQTYPGTKIIISDDGSPNLLVKEIGEKYAAKYNNIEYVRHNKNRGGFFNFGYTVSCAKSPFFMWAADDDEWHPEYIAECIQKLESFDYDLVFTKFNLFSNIDKKRSFLNHNLYLKTRFKKPVFLLLDECLSHKANISYGVWRTEKIKEVWEEGLKRGLGQQHMGRGFDNAFLTIAMELCNIYQIQRKLFYKNYMDRIIPGSLKAICISTANNFISFFKHPVIHIDNSLKNSRGYLETIKKVYGHEDRKSVKVLLTLKRLLYITMQHII